MGETMQKVKTFADLEWRPHPSGMDGKQGVAIFPNGYGVSVVRFKTMFGGYGSYTDNDNEWEVAVVTGTPEKFSITYNTPLTDDVIGHLTEAEVTDLMKQVAALPAQESTPMTAPGRPKLTLAEPPEDAPKRPPLTREQELEAMLAAKNGLIAERDDEIWRLQALVRELQAELERIGGGKHGA